MVYRAGDGAANRGSRRRSTGRRVVLRRHVPGERRGVPALVRGPRDRPPGALPGRRRCAPRRSSGSSPPGSSGPTRWRWPIHEKATDRLIGTCAFSQLDGENGSALYHITIGETDAWGQRLRHRGDPADARPRVRDARAAPDRAVRVRVQRARDPRLSALRVRRSRAASRESIWRDGRWWDEMAMSVLDRSGGATRAGGDGGRRRAAVAGGPADDRGRAGVGPDHRTGCGGRSEVAMTSRGRRGCGAQRVPRADRGQGPHGRQRAGRRRAARGRVRGRRPRADAGDGPDTSAT